MVKLVRLATKKRSKNSSKELAGQRFDISEYSFFTLQAIEPPYCGIRQVEEPKITYLLLFRERPLYQHHVRGLSQQGLVLRRKNSAHKSV